MNLPRVAACAIVRDEERTFPRLAESLRGIADYWVVVDTGSTDATRHVVRSSMQAIPGELHERPWVNFGVNRTQLLDLARGKASWLLLVDADQRVTGSLDVDELPDADALRVEHQESPVYWVPRLVRGDVAWRYVGDTHEYLDSADGRPYRSAALHSLKIQHFADGGARSTKFERDLVLLEAAVARDPQDERSWFYLGRTYQALGRTEDALHAYRTRVQSGGWAEETYYAQYQIGNLLAGRGETTAAITEWLTAWEMRPQRLEALCCVVRELRIAGKYHAGAALARSVEGATPPDDVLFVHTDVWAYDLPLERSICSYYVAGPQACLEQSTALLRLPDLPAETAEFARGNVRLCRSVLQGAAG